MMGFLMMTGARIACTAGFFVAFLSGVAGFVSGFFAEDLVAGLADFLVDFTGAGFFVLATKRATAFFGAFLALDLEIDFASFFFAEVFAIVTAFQHELSVDCNVASGSFKRQNGFLTGKCTRSCPLRASLWISVMFDWPLLVNSLDRLHHSPFVPE